MRDEGEGRKKSLDNINFTTVNRDEQQPKQLKPISMKNIKDWLENALFTVQL